MGEPAQSGPPDLRVKQGETVIFDVNGEKQMFITVRPNSKVKLGNSHVSVEPILGCLYGTLFTLSADGNSLVQTEHTPSADWAAAPPVAEASKNNANLLDKGADNQQLTQRDIDAMRKAGKGGNEIVAALTANSATFGTKTEFSQEKYKKKKAKKYIFIAAIRRPTAAAVCQAYYAKQPTKIGHLRLDALSLLLSLANVGAHARVLVLDACGGLVTAAVAERLGGYGSVTAAYVGAKPPGAEALRQFNFPPAVKATIRTVPLQRLVAEAQAAQQAMADEATGGAVCGAAAAAQQQQQQQAGAAGAPQEQGGGEATATVAQGTGAGAGTGTGQPEPAEHAMEVDPNPAAEPPAAPAESTTPEGAAGASSSPGSVPATETAAAGPQPPAPGCAWAPFTACIIAAPALSPSAALVAVLPLLAPSAPFACYSPWAQPLAEAMAEAQGARRAVGMALQECWWRDHQVLPLRTHPTMQMNHGGGYLLSGTAVQAEEGGGRSGSQGRRQTGGQAGRKRKA